MDDKLIEDLKSVGGNLIVDGVIKLLIGQVTFLAWPIINPILVMIVKHFVNLFILVVDREGYYLYTKLELEKKAKQYIVAAEKNAEVQKNGNEEEKNEAAQNLINVARQLRFNG